MMEFNGALCHDSWFTMLINSAISLLCRCAIMVFTVFVVNRLIIIIDLKVNCSECNNVTCNSYKIERLYLLHRQKIGSNII